MVPEYLCSWSRDSEIISFYISKFRWVWRDVGETPQIIEKTTDFWKIVLDSNLGNTKSV